MKMIRPNSDFIKIVSNTIWMVFDRVFVLVLNLLVSVRIANYYGARGYGSYQYVVSLAAIFEILATFIDARVVKKRYSAYEPDLVVMTATAARTLFSGCSAVVGMAFLFFCNDDPEVSVMFSLLLLNLIAGSAKFGMANRFEYLLESKKVVVATDLAAVAASLLQLLAVQRRWPVQSLALITLLSTLLSAAVIFFQYQAEFGSGWMRLPDLAVLKEMFVESIPLAVAGSCAILYTRCDTVMLGAMLTKAEAGIYSVSVSLIGVVQIAIAPIRESVYPQMIRLYEEDKAGYERRYIQISSILTWIYITGVAFSFLVLPYAFRFLKEEYFQALSVYHIHVLGTFFMYNGALRAGHYTLIKKGSILTWSQAISVVANVVMNFVGIQLWGIYGAAIATVTTQAATLMFSNLFFKEGKEVFKWQIQALNPISVIPK